MKHIIRANVWRKGLLAAALCSFAFGTAVIPEAIAQDKKAATEKSDKSKKPRRGKTDADHKELEANRILNQGIELLEAKQEERGVKALTQIGQQYPDTKAAVKADLALSDYYIEKKQFDNAVKHLLKILKEEDEEIQADALYKIGICYYNQNQFNQAFSHLRQVVNKFPGSVYANESYYYIGLCHFKLNRWNQAVDALERVGTSIPEDELANAKEGEVLAEAGQRLFIKIYDEDLIVLSIEDDQKKLTVELTNTNGDKEVVEMDKLGKETVTFIGSIPSAPGEPKHNDGVLQIKGGDVVSVTYLDTHTSSGKTDQKMVAKVALVSTATVGFTNGSYEEYCNGILADQDIFMRVRDLDKDLTPEKDTIQVTVKSIYKVEKPKDELAVGIDLDNETPEIKVRDTRTYTLTETDKRSGVFIGSVKPDFFDPDTQLEAAKTNDDPAGPLRVQKEDQIQIEYQDEAHILGREVAARTFKVPILIGSKPNVSILTPHIDDLEIKAKKNLIESKLLLHLSQIFKEMGLVDYANKRAGEGLEKIDEVLKINAEAALEHALLEDAFNTKWELLIVQDKIKEAIAVCTTLIKTFPDSVLVDRALVKIAQIKIMEGSDRSVAEGLNIYRGILQLPKSDLKAEAQFNIAAVMEEMAIRNAKERQVKDPTYRPNFGPVMLEYKKCSDNYPDSPFAGKALEKIAQFYVDQKDFNRVIEMMEQIFRDYPDADFLDSMLFTWAHATYELDRFEEALEKCEQLISEYPNSKFAAKAQGLRELIQRKVGQLAGEEE